MRVWIGAADRIRTVDQWRFHPQGLPIFLTLVTDIIQILGVDSLVFVGFIVAIGAVLVGIVFAV